MQNVQGAFLVQKFNSDAKGSQSAVLFVCKKQESEVNKMEFANVGTVVAIVVICYLVGLMCKQLPKVKDNFIPSIVGILGGILGVVGMFVIPEFPANNILDAVAVGIVSGLASTGANQAVKQIKEGMK